MITGGARDFRERRGRAQQRANLVEHARVARRRRGGGRLFEEARDHREDRGIIGEREPSFRRDAREQGLQFVEFFGR